MSLISKNSSSAWGKCASICGIVRGDNDSVVADPLNHVADEIFIRVHRDKALPEEILARLLRQRHIRQGTVQLGPLIQAVKQPGQPGAIAFQKRDSQLGKFLEYATGAETGNRQNQLHRITQRQGDDVGVGVAEEFIRHLILLRPRRRMKAQRDAKLLNFRPKRIVIAVMDPLAVDRLRTQRQRGYARAHSQPAALLRLPDRRRAR